MNRFADRVAAVTGGAGGIGAATVRRLAVEGARVVFCDVDAARGEALEAALGEELGARSRALGEAGGEAVGEVAFVHADVQHEREAEAFVGEAEARHGRLDVLVNNAAVRAFQDVTEASAESWDRIIGINLKGYVFCAKAAIIAMRRAGGGVVVNVASVRSLVAGPRNVQYDTIKAAILGLTRSAARDHAADGVRVVAVGPGPIFTPFHVNRARELGQSEAEYRAAFGADTMLDRPGEPEEVAAAIAFLASDEASFVTGTCLFVDGGQTGL